MPAGGEVIRRYVQDFTPDVVPLTTGRRTPGRAATRLSLVHDAANPEGFEQLYARAGGHLEDIPWARLTAHPALVAWLENQPAAGDAPALVVACGYGDDAEELSHRGYRVTAFDIAPTAIAWCRERFPESRVDYLVADLFDRPLRWRTHFDLVVEIRTLQSLPIDQRGHAVSAIAETVAPGGRLWLRCLAREDKEPVGNRPWPVSRNELQGFARSGLRQLEFRDGRSAADGGRSFTAVYQRGKSGLDDLPASGRAG